MRTTVVVLGALVLAACSGPPLPGQSAAPAASSPEVPAASSTPDAAEGLVLAWYEVACQAYDTVRRAHRSYEGMLEAFEAGDDDRALALADAIPAGLVLFAALRARLSYWESGDNFVSQMNLLVERLQHAADAVRREAAPPPAARQADVAAARKNLEAQNAKLPGGGC